MSEVQIELYGRVQGVRLRAQIRHAALQHSLRGYVLNRMDGSVFVCAQGEKKALMHFLAWLQTNPGLSLIEGMHYHWKNSGARYEDFHIAKEKHFLLDQAQSFINLGKRLFLSGQKVPRHVAIIPDGNRRWARKQGMHVQFGHYHAGSYAHMQSLLLTAQRAGVQYLSLWGFSTENWSRPAAERKAIFSLIQKSIPSLEQDAHRHHMRFIHVGRKDRLPKSLLTAFAQLERATARYHNFTVALCVLSYMEYLGSFFTLDDFNFKGNVTAYIEKCFKTPADYHPSILKHLFRDGLAHDYFARGGVSRDGLRPGLYKSWENKAVLDADTLLQDFLDSLDKFATELLDDKFIERMKIADEKVKKLEADFASEISGLKSINDIPGAHTSGATVYPGSITTTTLPYNPDDDK